MNHPAQGKTAMTQAEYARHAGVNRSQITRWLQSGRITALPSGLIDPVAADAQRSATESPMPHHQARKAQIEAGKAQPGRAEDVLAKDAVTHRKNVAVMLEREWMAAQREIEARKAAGELCEVSKAREAWRSAYVMLRTSLEGLASRAAHELSGHRGDVSAMEHALEMMVADALHECSATFERNIEGVA